MPTISTNDGRRPTSAAAARHYRAHMDRYVIDAATLLHLVGNDRRLGAGHQLVAPTLIRSQALSLLLVVRARGRARR